VCLVMLFTGLARGMSNDLQRRSQNLKAEIVFTRSSGTELTSNSASLSVKYVPLLREIDGVAAAVPAIRYISQGSKGFGFEQVEGVDWNEFAAMNEMHLVAGRAPEAVNEVVVDEAKAKNNNLSVGSDGHLLAGGRAAREDVSGRLAGRASDAGQVYLDLREGQEPRTGGRGGAAY
jgi:hypothetical protein